MGVRRWLFAGATLAMLAVPLGLWLARDRLIDWLLPPLLNRRPELLRVDWDHATVESDGSVHLTGLTLRVQGPTDQWQIVVDDVRAELDLHALLDRHLLARSVQGQGVTAWYRRRLDAPGDVKADPAVTPPIPGLENPPDPPPDLTPRAAPWRVTLESLALTGVREVWVDEWRYTGDAVASGGLAVVPGRGVTLTNGAATLASGGITRGDEPVAVRMSGTLGATITGMESAPPTADGRAPSLAPFLTARIQVSAQVEDLSFLHRYLLNAPWLDLGGRADDLVLDATLVGGRFQPGSELRADARDLVADVLSYRIAGDGAVRLGVEEHAGAARSRLSVRFAGYAVTMDGGRSPLIDGRGFSVEATSPVTALTDPLTSLGVIIEFPAARVRDVGEYNAFLPANIGLRLERGSGTVRGRMEATIPQNRARGELVIEGEDVRAQLDDVGVEGGLTLRAALREGWLDRGVYDVSGSSLELRDVALEVGLPLVLDEGAPAGEAPAAATPSAEPPAASAAGRSPKRAGARLGDNRAPRTAEVEARKAERAERRDERRGERLAAAAARHAPKPGWWAKLTVSECRVEVGAEVFLDARVQVTLRDTVPFVTVFFRKSGLPGWARGLLDIERVAGAAHVRLGDAALDIPESRVTGGQLEVMMRLRRMATGSYGDLFAALGKLALGAELRGESFRLQVAEPRRWYEARRVVPLPEAPPPAPTAPPAR